jgi:hypothetical protein
MTHEPTEFLPLEWIPIAAFDKNADQSKLSFIVWLPDGRFNEAWLDENGNFDGEWRHVATIDGKPADDVRAMEPVAFMLIKGPEFTENGRLKAA